jgi:putative membrane protein
MSEDTISIERFKTMERKLFYGIMTPGAVITVLLGLWMLTTPSYSVYVTAGWLHAKLLLIALMVGYHIWCGKLLSAFKYDRNQHSHVWFRWFNEVPVIFLVGIILLASLKPF